MAIQYTLAPLIKDGRDCLACGDVEGMECVVLESVEFYFGGSPWERITQQSEDIFALVEQEIIKWPPLDQISAARFRVRLRGEPRARRITIRPSGRASHYQEEINPVILDWVKKRKFVKVSPDASKSLE